MDTVEGFHTECSVRVFPPETQQRLQNIFEHYKRTNPNFIETNRKNPEPFGTNTRKGIRYVSISQTAQA